MATEGPSMPWCEACGLPEGHGQCMACLPLRYPKPGSTAGFDSVKFWAYEGDVSRLPPGIRKAAEELQKAWKERVEGEADAD